MTTNSTKTLKSKTPLIWGSSIGLAGIVFSVMSAMGYTAETAAPAKLGAFELNPELVKYLVTFLSVFVIPMLNSKWPGVGDFLSKLLAYFVSPQEETLKEKESKTEEDHFCDLHEIGLAMAQKGNTKGVEHCATLFKIMLDEAIPKQDEVQK